MDHQQKNDKMEKVKGLGRKEQQQEIGKGNQMTALRFQTGWDIRHPRRPFGVGNANLACE